MLLKNVFRNFTRAKLLTSLNILGLAMGISCAILIFLLIHLHTSFDNYHRNAGRTYRVVTNYMYPDGGRGFSAGVPSPVANAIRHDYSSLDQVCLINRYREVQVAVMHDTVPGSVRFKEQNTVAFVEPSFFRIFDYQWKKGNELVLEDSLTAVITAGYAKKYFGALDPIGQVLRLDNKINVVVKGVTGNIPENTFFREQIFVSYASRPAFEPAWHSNWNDSRSSTQCFVVLKEGMAAGGLDKQLRGLSGKYLDAEDARVRFFVSQPLSDIHLNTTYDAYLGKSAVTSFSLVGLFLILIACTNFINMATAQALTRTKEVGVKKAVGATRRQLVGQFIAETAVVVLISLLLALLITWLVIPPLNGLFLSTFAISLAPSWPLLLFLLCIYVATVLLSGLYPALVLSGFNPIQALAQRINVKTAGKVSLKRALVVFQFFTTYALIISAITMTRQLQLTREASMGFDKDGVVMVPVPVADSARMHDFRERISALKTVKNSSFLFTPPAYRSNIINSFYYQKREENKDITFNVKKGDENYVTTFGLELVAGSNFSDEDTVARMLVNEALVRSLPGVSNQQIIGKRIIYDDRDFWVSGVVRDFHLSSLRNRIMPCAVINDPGGFKNCAIKVGLADLNGTLNNIEKMWTGVWPEYVYELSFVADQIGTFYIVEDIVQKLINAFTIIAIIISSLGLYALIAFMAVQRSKEIGIRKTLGASVRSIIYIFVRELLKPTLLGFLLAVPVAYFAMSKWLSGYQYHISIGISIFLVSLVIPLIIALITISREAVKAAVVNPVKSLRNE